MLQLLDKIQDSTATMKDSTVTSSAVLNLERRLAVLEGQAAENQCMYNLVRNL